MNRRLIISAMMSMYLALAITNAAFAQDFYPAKEDFKAPKKEYSPYVEDHFPNRVYFGDTHLHTSKVETPHSANSSASSAKRTTAAILPW